MIRRRMRFKKSFLIMMTILLVYSIFLISFNFTHNLEAEEYYSLDIKNYEKESTVATTKQVSTVSMVAKPHTTESVSSPRPHIASSTSRANKKAHLVAFDGDVWWPGTNRTPTNYYQYVHCGPNNSIVIEITGRPNKLQWADIVFFEGKVPQSISFLVTHKPYIMVYTLESEITLGGETWDRADFRMWYNLEQSYPEPVTYFDRRQHIIDLLSPVKVEFEKKGLVVWAASNCFASNGREKLVEQLLKKMPVDSYGACMQNKLTSRRENMSLNLDLYSQYKFAIVIENSNCDDYVTEKLVHAVAAGTIPIVASRNKKPDYSRFMPKHSYINVYDYQTVDELVAYLNHLASNKTEYEKYFYFKSSKYNATYLRGLETSQLVKEAKKMITYEENKALYEGIIDKERSENKFCKLARYILSKNSIDLRREIEDRRTKRPTANACLPVKDLANHFNQNKTFFY